MNHAFPASLGMRWRRRASTGRRRCFSAHPRTEPTVFSNRVECLQLLLRGLVGTTSCRGGAVASRTCDSLHRRSSAAFVFSNKVPDAKLAVAHATPQPRSSPGGGRRFVLARARPPTWRHFPARSCKSCPWGNLDVSNAVEAGANAAFRGQLQCRCACTFEGIDAL